jgi:hypothetical protein
MNKYAYVLMRVDEDNDGYDADYPVEAAFTTLSAAEKYRVELYIDDEDTVYEIVRVPLVEAIGEEDEA